MDHECNSITEQESPEIWQQVLLCRQAVNNTMQKFGLKTTKSKRARREAEAEEEAEAALRFKVSSFA